MANITNIFAEYYLAIYKTSDFIEENVKNVTKNRKKIIVINAHQSKKKKKSLRLGTIGC